MVNAQCQNKLKVVTSNNSAYNISQYKLTQAHTQEGTNYPDTRTWNLSPNGERGGQVERREKILSIVFEKNRAARSKHVQNCIKTIPKIIFSQFYYMQSLPNSTIFGRSDNAKFSNDVIVHPAQHGEACTMILLKPTLICFSIMSVLRNITFCWLLHHMCMVSRTSTLLNKYWIFLCHIL